MQFFLDFLRVGFEHAKTLVVGLLCVVAGQIDERALVPALRHQNMHPRGASALARVLLGKEVFQRFAVLKIDRNVKVAGYVGLADVELLQQRGKEFAG